MQTSNSCGYGKHKEQRNLGKIIIFVKDFTNAKSSKKQEVKLK